MKIKKIMSGGQTGVDQGALTAAIELNIPHGGWCPKGRRCEWGRIPKKFELTETNSSHYPVRTEKNIKDSDGTLVLIYGSVTRGSQLSIDLARRLNKPCLVLNLGPGDVKEAFDPEVTFRNQLREARGFVEMNKISVLNVSGSRESKVEGIGLVAKEFISALLKTTHSTRGLKGEGGKKK